MIGKSVLLLLGAFLVGHSAAMEPTLDCPGVMKTGEFVGTFLGVISKAEWVKINYLFKPDGNAPFMCVHLDDIKNPTRANLLWDAYKSGSKVKILVTGDHEVTGISFTK